TSRSPARDFWRAPWPIWRPSRFLARKSTNERNCGPSEPHSTRCSRLDNPFPASATSPWRTAYPTASPTARPRCAPEFYMPHWGLARAYLRQGRYDEALAELAYDGADHVGLHKAGLLGYAHALAGNAVEARRILDELHAKIDRGEYVAPIDVSVIHIGLGEYDEALTWLDQVADDRGSRIFLCDPIFDPFRNHPRFNRIRERLGLAGTNVTS